MPAYQKRASDSVIDGCETPWGCWELNSGFLEEQPVLLNPWAISPAPCLVFETWSYCVVQAGLHICLTRAVFISFLYYCNSFLPKEQMYQKQKPKNKNPALFFQCGWLFSHLAIRFLLCRAVGIHWKLLFNCINLNCSCLKKAQHCYTLQEKFQNKHRQFLL